MASVVLAHVDKTFPPDVRAVVDFSLEVGDGELVVLLGPSGCGKSTALNMIAGLEDPTSGSIMIGGRVVNDDPPAARNIAMVFQDYALYPHMTVRENLGFGLKMRGTAKADIAARIQRAARTLGIDGLLERKPRALSGGQRQRVAVGRAIVRDPAVFLFDEPLSNLDSKLRVAMRAEIKELHLALKRTMIYVTHDQLEAMTLATRIVVIKQGVIQQVGTPMEIYEQPTNRVVADVVGTPPTSFLSGVITSGRFVAAGVSLKLAHGRGAALPDGAVILGIRPESIDWKPPEGQDEADGALDVRVRLVEPVGGEYIVHLEVGEATLLAKLDTTQAPGVGDTPRLHVDLSRVHIFELGDDGVNLTVGSRE